MHCFNFFTVYNVLIVIKLGDSSTW